MPDPLPTPIPLPDELREMREKAAQGPWFVGGPDDTGLLSIDDGCVDGMFPVTGEAHEIRFIVALVNWFDTLTATKPSGQVERVARAIDPNAWEFIDAHEHDEPPHPAVPLTRERTLKQARAALAALSTQVQTVGGE